MNEKLNDSNKRQILFFHHSGFLGGAPKSLSLLLDNLNLNNYRALLILIKNGPVVDLFKNKPIPFLISRFIYPFHGSTVVPKGSFRIIFRNIFGAPITFFAAIKLIKKYKPDLIHLNSSSLCIVGLAAKVVDKNIKVVCHVREPLRESIFGNVIRFFCKRSIDSYIAIDRFTGASMKSLENTEIIYNAVDFSIYNDDVRSRKLKLELGLSDDSIIFLYLARVAEGNGAIEFVKAANILTSSNTNFHFVVCGFNIDLMDSYSSKVKNLSENNKNVHLLGFRQDVTELIASSDIMVIPFTEPHFARSAIEASSMGKPCIGANIGGVQELIVNHRTGLLFDNVDELVRMCRELGLNKSVREKFGKNGSLFAKKNFDSVYSAKRVFSIYSKLLDTEGV